jgi:hypothetical protein
MPDKLCLALWTWYASDDYKPVLMVCELAQALLFLARPAAEQASSIPYCPACETWSEMMLPVDDFLNGFTEPLDEPLRLKLGQLWTLCNALDATAFRCDDFQMFHHPDWAPLRATAIEALDIMGWEMLAAHQDELLLESRQKLFPHFFRNQA